MTKSLFIIAFSSFLLLPGCCDDDADMMGNKAVPKKAKRVQQVSKKVYKVPATPKKARKVRASKNAHKAPKARSSSQKKHSCM